METTLNKPFNLSGLMETINSTQDKLLLEHKSLKELQLNVDSLNNMKTLSKFSFNPLHALSYDTHKLVTMGLSYTVICIILILLCICCFNICTDCTQCFTYVRKNMEKQQKEEGDIHEFENLQNNTMKTSEPTTPTAPKWILRTIDDEPYLIYTESEKFF